MTEKFEEEEKEREFYNTLEQERILLKCLFTQLLTAKKYFSKIKEELFSSAQRVWMFRHAKQIFRDTGNLFNEGVISLELDRIKKVSVELFIGGKRTTREISHTEALAEWNMIIGSDISHTAEWLISDLETRLRSCLFMAATEKAIERVYKGESDEAISDLNSEIIKIRANVNRNKPLRRLSDAEWQIEIIKQKQENPHLYSVLKTGLPTFDALAGLYRGEITLITAHTGVGKSTLMRSMAVGAAKSGLNVLFIVNEEIEDQAGAKFAVASAGGRIIYKSLKKADEDTFNASGIEDFRKELKEFGETGGEIFIQELPQFHTCADIEEILVELNQQGQRIDIVMLDYLDHLKPMEKSWSEVDEQNKAIAEFKSICMQFRIAGVTATQADTASVDLEHMNAYNVRGSKQKSGAANIVMAIKELTPPDAVNDEGHELKAVTWKIMIIKNRDGAKCSFVARFHKVSGLVKEKSDCTKEEICKMESDLAMSGKKGKKKGGGGKKSVADVKEDGAMSAKTSSEKEKTEEEKEIKEETRSVAEMTDLQDDYDETKASESTEAKNPDEESLKIAEKCPICSADKAKDKEFCSKACLIKAETCPICSANKAKDKKFCSKACAIKSKK